MTRWMRTIGLAGGVAMLASIANAEPAADSSALSKPDLIYGGELMTPDEIADYNRRLSGDITPDQREEFMREHKERMDERASERGVAVKDPTKPAQDDIGGSKGGGGGGGNIPGGVGSGPSGIGGVGGAGSGGGVGP
jgi:hypothetical protein